VKRHSKYVFTGEQGRKPKVQRPDTPQEPEPYVASPDLIEAVNLAIFLERPLLLEGEAGAGKTRLARAVAYELGLPFYPWYVRSTSKASEGLYTYDAVLRLHDVQLSRLEQEKGTPSQPSASTKTRDPGEAKTYRTLGAMGRAFELTEYPAVVLIDEIDKADIDFPNDLLTVIDNQWEFKIPETDEVIRASKEFKPIVIITSNKEKGNLPAPFLRRCIYHFIEFPEDAVRLQQIIDVHYGEESLATPSTQLTAAAIGRFLSLRKYGGLHKRPGTSEFLDWLQALNDFGSKPFSAQRLADEQQPVPYPDLLFKLRDDWKRIATSS
jgi:MoxR-like ATPase